MNGGGRMRAGERILVAHIHVCPLSKVPGTVRATGARCVLTLLDNGTPMIRPAGVEAGNHLVLPLSDISAALEGHTLASETHVEQILSFVRRWDQASPLLIHCWAGVSRSTAAAFIAACSLRPGRHEAEIAWEVRAKSPTATPNARLVAVADALLRRQGRMIEAIESIGRGADCAEGTPFALELH